MARSSRRTAAGRIRRRQPPDRAGPRSSVRAGRGRAHASPALPSVGPASTHAAAMTRPHPRPRPSHLDPYAPWTLGDVPYGTSRSAPAPARKATDEKATAAPPAPSNRPHSRPSLPGTRRAAGNPMLDRSGEPDSGQARVREPNQDGVPRPQATAPGDDHVDHETSEGTHMNPIPPRPIITAREQLALWDADHRDRDSAASPPPPPPGRVWLTDRQIACGGCGRAVPPGVPRRVLHRSLREQNG